MWSTLADELGNIYATIWENYHEPRPPIIRYLMFLKLLNQFQSFQNHKELWNIATAVKCHLLPATHFIRSVNVTGTSRTVTNQTKSNILCSEKWWILILGPNEHIFCSYKLQRSTHYPKAQSGHILYTSPTTKVFYSN